jgi:hypothetical protein
MRNILLLLACASALAIAPGLGPQGAGLGSVLAVAGAQEPRAPGAAPGRYRVAYARWRQRLQRHDLHVGRNLLREVRVAGSASGAAELRRAIWRMQKRWWRWLRTSARGRAVRFKIKVRNQVPSWGKDHLRSIARCESRNDPRAVGGGGTYRGLYQFSFSTWRVMGGNGDPAAASRWEQTWRAWLLLSRHGSGHWPVCG